MNIFQSIINAAKLVFEVYLPFDTDLISPEAKSILSNPSDKEKYLKAIDNMRGGSKKETIVLENGKELTLES